MALLVSNAGAGQDPDVIVCHNPGTHEAEEVVVLSSALQRFLELNPSDHEGPCQGVLCQGEGDGVRPAKEVVCHALVGREGFGMSPWIAWGGGGGGATCQCVMTTWWRVLGQGGDVHSAQVAVSNANANKGWIGVCLTAKI